MRDAPDVTSRPVRIQIVQGKGGWRVRYKARNGRIIWTSEGYSSKGNARRAAARVHPDVTPEVLSELHPEGVSE